MTNNKTLKALGWLLGGVAVGMAFGLLYAPKAGKETRRDVADWLRKKREQTKDLAHKLRERFPAKKEAVVAALRAGKDAFTEAGNHKQARETVAA